MPSIDERVVSMAFENAKFEAGIAKTMASLTKLNASLKAVGTTHGLGDIEKAANKVNLTGISSALDKLKQKLTFDTKPISDLDSKLNNVSLGPLGSALDTVKGKLSGLFAGPSAAIDTFKSKFGFAGAEQSFTNLENASNRVKFVGAQAATENLKSKLRFSGVEQNFADIEKASGRVRLTAISSAVANVGSQFSILSGAASVALGSITANAATRGASIAKSLSLGPITQGFEEYSTNLNSIQTILANTKVSGAGLKDVNSALQELNRYSDQTIYNFSQMAKNIGTFTAAGVDLETATGSIKGIANLAALSGSNSEQASTAMYQLSQAISAGRVSLQDWNSVVNAGMGGTVFQRALAQTAESMGTLSKGSVELKGKMKNVTIEGQSFRESITAKPGEQSWLTSEVLTNTLKQFTGDLSVAELKAQGFNDAQIKAIQETAKTAKLAATEVKTLSGVFDVVKESIGSGWAATFQLIFGDFEEAKSTFTDLSTAITGFVGKNADARNKVLTDWKELGGRKELIEGIKDVFEGLGSILKPVKDAFREIFPPKTGKDLFDLTERFREFAKELKIGPETANNLRRTFSGFFAVLSIGKTIVGKFLGVIGDLFGAAGDGSGGFLEFTANIGELLVRLKIAIDRGAGLTKFFDGLSSVLQQPIMLLSKLAGAFGSLLDGFDGSEAEGVTNRFEDINKSLSPMERVINAVKGAWANLTGVFSQSTGIFGSIVKQVKDFGSTISTAFENADYDGVFAAIQTGLIGGIFLTIKKGIGGGVGDIGGGVLKNLSGSMDALTGSLSAMQTKIKAQTLLLIASAVGVLAAGVVALSLVDPKRLSSAMTAVAVGLGELVGAMKLLTGIGGPAAIATMPIIAGSLVVLAFAVDTLAIAVFAFSKLDWEELLRGLAGVGGALVAIGIGVRAIPPSVALIGPALIPLALALNGIALAVKIFSTMDWEELARGLVGVGGALTAVGVGTKLMGPSILLIGPGLIGVAVALNIMAGAVLAFGSMDLETMGKGLLGIAGSLIAIGVAIGLIPPMIALQAAGLILLSVALTGIAGAIALMGNLDIETLAKGIGAIGVALVVLAGGLTLMSGTIPGTIALMGAATALAVLAPVIGLLGTMKLTTIAKGLGAIAAAILVIGAAGIIAAPGLTALGVSMLALGAGVSLVGAGVYLLTTGLVKLGGDGSKGIAAVMVALTALVALLPKIIIDFIKGLVQIVEGVASLAPKIAVAMGKVLITLLDVVIKAAPKMGLAFTALVVAGANAVAASAPSVIEAGWQLLIAFLKGIQDHIGEVVTTVGKIMTNFFTAVISFVPRLIASGAKVLLEFLRGITNNLPKILESGGRMLVTFLEGIANGLPKLIGSAAKVVLKFLEGLSSKADDLVLGGAKIINRILEGLTDAVPKLVAKAVSLVASFIRAIGEEAPKLAKAGFDAAIDFINGISKEIASKQNADKLVGAGANLGGAIVQGLVNGVTAMVKKLNPVNLVKNLAKDMVKGAFDIIKPGSPSKVFTALAETIPAGLALGVNRGGDRAVRSVEDVGNDMITAMRTKLSVVPSVLDGLMDMDPTITPVLDLSAVTAEAKKLSDLTNVTPITAAASFQQAVAISSAQETAQTVPESPSVSTPTEIKFEQNNYSPESLSTTEIYRLTRNQLVQAKTALGLVS